MATRIVVGLGNPGEAYEDTRHNLGFEAVDRIAAELGIELAPGGPMWIGSADHDECLTTGVGEGARAPAAAAPEEDDAASAGQVVLVKPATYMNLSGNAVLSALERYPAIPADVLVVVDDMSLPSGAIRLRRKGSDGGHNGLKSIMAALGTNGFPRLRIGIGPPASSEAASSEPSSPEDGEALTFSATDHVLGRFTPDERVLVDEALARATQAALAWIRMTDLQEIMNTFNRRPTPAADPDESGGDERSGGCSDGES